MAIFAAALFLSVGLMAVSGAYIFLGAFLHVRGGRNLRLDSEHLAIWPDFFPAIDIHAGAAPAYLIGGLVAFFVGIPVMLALLEKLYLRLMAEDSETSSDSPNEGETISNSADSPNRATSRPSRSIKPRANGL